MPAEMERNLKSEARKKFGSTTSEKARKYIYGTMRKTGWKPSHQKQASADEFTMGYVDALRDLKGQ